MTTSLKEKPILFTPAMALAVYEGRKTQTRRVMKPQPVVGRYGPRHPSKPNGVIGPLVGAFGGGHYHIWKHPKMDIPMMQGSEWAIERHCPYGAPGDRLFVREQHFRFGHWERADGLKPRQRSTRQRWKFVPDSEEVRFDPPVGFRKGRLKEDPATPAWHRRPNIHMLRRNVRSELEVVSVRMERVESVTDDDAVAEGFNGYRTDDPHRDVEPREDFLRTFYDINQRAPKESNPWVWVVEFTKIGEAP